MKHFISRTLAALAAALVLTTAVAEASIRLIEDRPEGLVVAWQPEAGRIESHRLALPPAMHAQLSGLPAAAARITDAGWRGLVPTSSLVLDPSGLPNAGASESEIVFELAWVPGAPPSTGLPPGLRPGGVEAAVAPDASVGGTVPATAELLNPATAARAADAALADRSLRPAMPRRLPVAGGFRPARRSMALGESRLPGEPGDSGGPRAMGFGTSRVKIVVAPDDPGVPGGAGLYRLTHAMLSGLGLDMSGVALSDLRLVTIDTTTSLVGQAIVPLRRHDADADGLFGAGDWIEFWGEPMLGETLTNVYQSGDYTDDRGYILESGAAAPSPEMPEDRDGTPVSPPSADRLATIRAEVNDVFVNNSRTGALGVDHFYWCSPQRLSWISGDPEAVRSETLALPGLLAGSARRGTLRVRLLQRMADVPATPDHRSVVDLNARASVSDVTGDGQEQVTHVATGLVAGTDLLASNTVTIRAPGVAGATANLFELDWIEADYPRSFDLERGRLVFTHDTGWSVVARGVPAGEITVLDVTDPLDPHVVTNVVRAAGTAAFELSGDGSGDPVRYAVQETPAGEPALRPATLTVLPDTGLRDPGTVADVVVLAPRAWLAPELPQLQAWRTRRQSEGMAVRLVSTEDAIDEFGSGSFTPAALAGLLTEAFATWARPPSYALLLGDTTLDYKDLLGGRALDPTTCTDSLDPCGYDETGWVQHVPTRVLDRPDDTQFLGWYASDVIQTIVAGSDWEPDVALGRIPARDAGEAGALLQKVLDYEDLAATRPAWGERVMLVADQIVEPIEQNFETFQNTARDAHLLPRWQVSEMYYQRDYGGDPPEPFTQELLDAWRDPAQSAAVISYVGHGSAYRWSSDDLLLNRGQTPCRDDVETLSGPGIPEPFILNANCITGTFVYPLGPSLLEELVRQPQGGAIAAYGPTGVTELAEAQDVLNAAYGTMHGRDGRGGRAGDVVLAIQGSLAFLAPIDALPLLSNAYLGDPTLKLAVPYGPAAISLTATPGDSLVDLSWPAVPGAAAYAIWRSDNGAGGTYRLIADGVAGPSLRDTGDPPGPAVAVVNNQLYHYALEPLDADGNPGRWSARVPARPCTLDVPAAAGALTVTPGACTGGFTVRWGASPTTGLQGYRLRVYRGPAATGTPVRVVMAPGTFAPVSGLERWQEYTFTVNPLTWCDIEGPVSGPVTSRSTCPLALDVPAFIPDLRVDKQGSDVRLQWSPVTTTVRGTAANIATYRVHRAGDPAFLAGPPTTVSDAAPTTFTDAGRIGTGPALEFYAVAAIDTAGRSGGVAHDLPQGVRGLASTDLGTEWELTWTPVKADIRGERTPMGRYLVYASDTAIDRARIEAESLVPVTTVVAPPARVPDAPGLAFFFVVPEDVHGNRSAD